MVNDSYIDKFKALKPLQKFAVVFLIFFGIYYRPIEIKAGFGPQHIILMATMIVTGVIWNGIISPALIIGIIYFLWQICTVLTLSDSIDSIRWVTLFYSFGLVFSYVGFYNLVYGKKIFTLDIFINLLKFMMGIAFIFCSMQQLVILAGIHSLPLINLMSDYTERGPLACNSLYQEMSVFARFMLVCYYGYVKCSEIKRGKGKYTLRELLRGEHRWVTLRFLWMMLTMSSGTAIIALLAFSLYFITKKNAIILIPVFIIAYGFLYDIENEQLQRGLRVIEATSTLDREQIIRADHSASFRIVPVINSLHADFTKLETWFGHGLDYAANNKLIYSGTSTLFEDYGFIMFLLGYIFNLTCAYKINSLGAVFMIIGLGGGLIGNINYGWELAMLMTVIRYFIEQRQSPRMM